MFTPCGKNILWNRCWIAGNGVAYFGEQVDKVFILHLRYSMNNNIRTHFSRSSSSIRWASKIVSGSVGAAGGTGFASSCWTRNERWATTLLTSTYRCLKSSSILSCFKVSLMFSSTISLFSSSICFVNLDSTQFLDFLSSAVC